MKTKNLISIERLILAALVLCLSVFSAYSAEDLKEIIRKGNDLYKKHDYENAIEIYEKVLKSGLEAPEIYYNLGNAYFKSNKFTSAILNYERAKNLDPQNEDINFNLKVANQHVVDVIEPLPEFFLTTWFTQLYSSQSSDFWAVFSVLSFILFLTSIMVYLLFRVIFYRKFAFVLGIVFIVLCSVSFVFSFKKKQMQNNHESAILMLPAATVKSSPDQTGTDLFVIHEGLKVQVVDSSGDWREIRLRDGRKGWLLSAAITRI
jgi:tetratricopeptide (TPR) repeat protein